VNFNLDGFKKEQKQKHAADKANLLEFNKALNSGVISKGDKKKRLNLIRQMNSRKYRYAAKVREAKNQMFIDRISTINKQLKHKEIDKQLQIVKQIEDPELCSASEET
jgi:hypothetical protein